MSETDEQFALVPTEDDDSAVVPPTLYFLTNRQNLLEVISSGLVAPVDTYDKYYDDLLRHAPGRIVVGARATGQAVAAVVDPDDPGSYPVLVELAPDRVPGSAPSFSDGSQWLAPEAVVPVAGSVVHFRNQTELDEHRLSAYENVDHDSFEYMVTADLFEKPAAGDTRLVDWLKSLPPGKELGSDYRGLDRSCGATALLACAVRTYPDAMPGYIAYLNADTPPAPPGERRGWPTWLRQEIVTATDTTRPKGAEQRALVALIGVLGSVDTAAGFRSTEVIREIADSALSGRIAKAERAALTASFEAATSVLEMSSDFVPDDPRIELSAVRGALYALLRPEPARLLTLFAEDSIRDSWSALTATALVGLTTGRRRIATDIRATDLDLALAEETAARLMGLPLPTYALSTETRPDGTTSATAEIDGRAVLTVELPARQLTDLLHDADLDAEPASSVALELARALGWHECIRTTLFLPPGEHSISSEARGKGIVLSFIGPARAERTLLPELFLRRLETAPEIPAELSERLLTRLDERSSPPGHEPA